MYKNLWGCVMDLEKAKEILVTGGYTCVLCRAEQIITSNQRGVAPLMELWDAQRDVTGFSAADKVVGKATALLYCLLGVKSVYAMVMSRPALAVLEAHGIEIGYEQLVDAIRNRTNTGFCPIETATRDIHDPKDAPQAIRKALASRKP